MHQVSRHYNSVIVWETCLGILNKTAFFVVVLDSKYSKMTPKICKAEVRLTPLINKICKPWMLKLIRMLILKIIRKMDWYCYAYKEEKW